MNFIPFLMASSFSLLAISFWCLFNTLWLPHPVHVFSLSNNTKLLAGETGDSAFLKETPHNFTIDFKCISTKLLRMYFILWPSYNTYRVNSLKADIQKPTAKD